MRKRYQEEFSLKKKAEDFISQLKFLKLKGNLSAKEITEFYLIPENGMTNAEKDELEDYIKRIIESMTIS